MKNAFFKIKSNSILWGIIILAGLLRIPYLDTFPPSLYSDEVNQAYNAYSILKTGADEHGAFLPVSFRSFGDWKPPVQTYVMIPTIALFGLTPTGVRLPSAVLGTATVALVYLLVRELFAVDKKQGRVVALLSAFFLAISPWHIHQSRAAMLISVELFCMTGGVLTFFKALKNSRWFFISALFWVLGIYSYYGMRLIVPLMVGFLVWQYKKSIKWRKRNIWGAMGIGIVLLLPLLIGFFYNPNVIFGRARTVSVFYDQGVNLKIWEAETQDGQIRVPIVITRIFHNKPISYARDIMRRFFSHFDGRFLFITGDTSLPFQIPHMGILYLFDAVFLFVGFLYLMREQKERGIIIFWILVSILPASLSYLTPSGNRSFTAVVPFVIITAYGVTSLYKRISYKVLFQVVISFGYVLSFIYFFYQYTVSLPRDYANWWYFGYKELISYLNTQTKYDEIVISGKLSVPYIYVLFFNHIDPRYAQTHLNRDLRLDEFGFEHVSSFDTYRFPRYFSWEKDYGKLSSRSLLVVTPEEHVGKEAILEKTITYPNNKGAYLIYRIEDEEK